MSEIVVLDNFRELTSGNRQPLPFSHFPLLNGKQRRCKVNSIECFEVARVCLVVCSLTP